MDVGKFLLHHINYFDQQRGSSAEVIKSAVITAVPGVLILYY